MADGERRLAAIMFTDIVGYTHLSQTNESLALELLQEHQRLLRPTFAPHGGIEVKTIGDAFLVEFKSALEAVVCAVEMQKKMGERNAEAVPSRKLELRIGIHVGDVVHGPDDDIFGDAVNVASRIEPLAEPGGVCISQQVFDQIGNKTALEIDKVGDVKLKNVDLPLGVYKVNLTGSRRSSDEHSGPRERLGVLPFVNISPDPSDEYFADGLTEELISKLSEIKGLKVIARTSVMSYKRKDKKVSEIARELGVGSIIEGSVRKAGNRIRISVQLIDARTEEHLWSSNYDSKLDDIFAIQSDVASKVAASLSAGYFFRETRKDTNDVEAYTLYLRAMQLSYETTEASMKETVALLQRAISKDPAFARAYAGLAGAWHMLAVSGYEDFAAMASNAEAAAAKALVLDPGLAEAHSAMAGVHSMFDRFDAALVEAEAAVRINPNLSDAYMSLGILDAIMRTPGEALPMFRKAYELDPLSPGAGEVLASAAAWVGEAGQARDVLARLREFNPKNAKVYLCIADYHMEKKEFDEAQKMVDVARDLSPGEPSIALSQGLLFAFAGKRKEAKGALKELLANGNESFRLFGELNVQAALGNLDEAFRVLMRQADMHSWPFSIRIDPLFAEMRKDPRFLEFCRKVGIKA
ncbi:MAG: adenylate/guanylate cyclase domain-containing protein [Thaumarchaeota archaeon]|nr:adenylate/guanylate cyclase domain-containing protein [Nitrososphaerota archaeon]